MIKIETRSSLQGVEKYGSCVSCGKERDVFKISFADLHNNYTYISLCRECMAVLGDFANKTVQREAEGLSEDDYRIEYKEKSTGMVKVIDLSIGNPYWDNIYREGFRSGEYELISGKLPDGWEVSLPGISEEL